MAEGKEEILQHENLRDFLEWSTWSDKKDYYDNEEKRITELAEKFGVTPLRMGQLDFSLDMIDYEMKLPDDEREPYVEAIHSIAEELGDGKTKDIIHNWLLERVGEWHTNLVPDFPKTTSLAFSKENLSKIIKDPFC